jgi:hypothetical protein
VKHFVFFLCLVCLLGFAPNAFGAETPLPSAPGTIWHYQMTQEFGEGVHPSDKSLTPDAQGKIHLPIDIYLTGKQRVGDVDTLKYDMYRQGAVSLTEFLTVDEKGVTAIARSAENGEPSLCVPPQKILNFPPRAGEKWNYKGSVGDTETEQTFEMIGQESVQAPAGKFDAFHLRLTQVAPTPPNVVEDRWFVPNIGYVKIVTTMTLANGNLLQRITLDLSEGPKVGEKPAAAAPSASPAEKKLLHAALAKELTAEPTTSFTPDLKRIFCRWQGEALHKGDKIRCVWIAEDVGEVAPPNYKVDETDATANGPEAFGTFTLSRPNKGWPLGKYRVELYAGDQLADTLKFTIAAAK